MTLAHRLHGNACSATIIEAAPTTGGLAESQTIGGYTWDRFYHVILLSDSHLRRLLDELGFSHRMQWRATRTGFYTDGTLYSLSNGIEFLRFPPLSLLDKVRLAGTILYASRLRDWHSLERISAVDWLRRLSGERTFTRIWLPLLKSKLGENYALASAAFIWAIIARMYAARRAGLKQEMFGYVDGGYSAVLKAFRATLERRGVRTLSGRAAHEVRDRGDRVDVHLAGGEIQTFDKVVLTVPCGQVLRICPGLAPSEQVRLRNVVYQGIVCPSLLLRRSLADFYITNITEPWPPFTAVIEMTALVDRAVFGGNALVYLPRYLAQDDEFWEKSDEEIRETFVGALERMYPEFDRADILAFQIGRVREMLAVSTLNYSEIARPPLRTSLPNVFIVNSAQIANGTLNVNETVSLAESGAAQLQAAFLEPPSFGSRS